VVWLCRSPDQISPLAFDLHLLSVHGQPLVEDFSTELEFLSSYLTAIHLADLRPLSLGRRTVAHCVEIGLLGAALTLTRRRTRYLLFFFFLLARCTRDFPFLVRWNTRYESHYIEQADSFGALPLPQYSRLIAASLGASPFHVFALCTSCSVIQIPQRLHLWENIPEGLSLRSVAPRFTLLHAKLNVL
jgi:hypothetical protein